MGAGRELFLVYTTGALSVLVAGLIGVVLSLRLGLRVPRPVPYLILAGSTYLLAAQLLKLYSHKDYVDFTVSLEVIANIARGRGPWSSLQAGLMPGTGNWLSTHFTPLVVYLFAVPFAVVPRAETLLVCQFLALSATLVAIYLYAKRRLGSHKHALIIAAVVALYPTYQYIHLHEFEMLRFSLPLLVLAFYALDIDQPTFYWLCVFASLLVREDVAITTFLLGLYVVVFMKHRMMGAITAATALMYFAMVTEVIMPRLRTAGGSQYVAAYWFAQFGTTIPQIAVGMLTKPGALFHAVLQPVKLANIFMYGLPLLWIPLLAWPVLLIGAGNVGIDLLSGSISHTSYFLYYQTPALAFVFIALVQGVARLGAMLNNRAVRRSETLDGTSAALYGLLSAALVANLFFGPSPLSLQFWFHGYRLAPFRTLDFHYTEYRVAPHDRLASGVLAAVPMNASVSAEQALLPLLYDRRVLKVFPDISGVNFVAVDKTNPIKTGVATIPGSWDGLRQHPQYYYDWVEKDSSHWRLVAHDDGYILYQRVGAAQGTQGRSGP